MNQHKKGILAESFSVVLLRLLGYKIIKQRYKTKLGEIDIIAKKRKTIFLFEVKYRKTAQEALESITPQQISRIKNAFLLYTQENHLENYDVIIKIIALSKSNLPKIVTVTA